jgi:hypothetical protein
MPNQMRFRCSDGDSPDGLGTVPVAAIAASVIATWGGVNADCCVDMLTPVGSTARPIERTCPVHSAAYAGPFGANRRERQLSCGDSQHRRRNSCFVSKTPPRDV